MTLMRMMTWFFSILTGKVKTTTSARMTTAQRMTFRII